MSTSNMGNDTLLNCKKITTQCSMRRLKSLRSVQISSLEPKITPEVLRIDQYCEKIVSMLASKLFFSERFDVATLPSLLPYR